MTENKEYNTNGVRTIHDTGSMGVAVEMQANDMKLSFNYATDCSSQTNVYSQSYKNHY